MSKNNIKLKNIDVLDINDIPENILSAISSLGWKTELLIINEPWGDIFLKKVHVLVHEPKQGGGWGMANGSITIYLEQGGVLYSYSSLYNSNDSSGLVAVEFEKEDEEIIARQCRCDIKVIMNSGCQCGGY